MSDHAGGQPEQQPGHERDGHLDRTPPAAPDDRHGHAASERTGVPAVDAVLEAVESVGTLPVAEHVRVYEMAHEQLRRALDATPGDPPGRSDG